MVPAMTLGLFCIDKVQSPRLNFTVNKGTDKTGQNLLRLGVAVRLS